MLDNNPGSYAGLFALLMLGVVGLPVPDETLLVSTGYLVWLGRLHPVGAFLAALAGSWCGITVSYVIGRTLGLGFVHRFGKYVHLTDERLALVHVWFDRSGSWALFFGYYIPGVRHFTAIVAGTTKVRLRHFLAYAWSGGLLWVTIFMSLGYWLGDDAKRVVESAIEYPLYAALAVVVVAVGYFLWRRRSA